jgi:hypothetical protein
VHLGEVIICISNNFPVNVDGANSWDHSLAMFLKHSGQAEPLALLNNIFLNMGRVLGA